MILTFLKDYGLKHWKELLIIVLFLVLYIKGRVDYASLYDVHMSTVNEYEKRIEDLNSAHKKQLEKKDEAIKEYIQRVEDLRIEYDAQKERNREERTERKEKIEKILIEKPEELVTDIEQKFGFDYVE